MRQALGSTFLAAMLIGLMATSGCYTYRAVSPSELPKLNKTYTTTIGVVKTNYGVSTLRNESYTQLKTPDGRLLAVEGRPSEVRLTLRTGRVLTIETPYQFEPVNGNLNVSSASYPAFTLAPEDIQRAELSVFDGTKAAILGTVILLVVLVGCAFMIEGE